MKRRKIGHICAFFYFSLYFAAMVIPRKLPYEQFSSLHSNFIKRTFHQILYYGGPLEPVVNFFLLFPAFAILLIFLGRSRAIWGVAICIVVSATAESLQQLIPGRVSSVRDFALNSAGAVTAMLFYKHFKNHTANNHPPEISKPQ